MKTKFTNGFRKVIACICAVSLLLPAQAIVFAADISVLSKTGVTVSDPFALMYDSDELFLEKAEPILFIAEIEREDVQENIQEESTAVLSDFKAKRSKIAISREKSIDTRIVEQLSNVYEETRTERYIVKYKPDKRNVERKPELLILGEKRNPAEYAKELRASGAASEIVYIQPDFIMEYANIGLTYIEFAEGINDFGEKITEDEELYVEELEDEEEQFEFEELAQNEIIVALIDSGVDTSHYMLEDKMLQGWNFINNTANVYDATNPLASAHGTHIAGIIAQNGGSTVKILPLQVFGSHGAYTSDIISAIEYAEAQGAKIVNMSFGSKQYNLALKETMENSSMLFITSVGNRRSNVGDNPIYPACFGLSNTISVTSVNSDGGFSYYSNFNSNIVDIAAVGRDVVSALPDNKTGPMTGTSMAAGQISAAAAFTASIIPEDEFTADNIKNRLIKTGEQLSNLQNKVKDGRRLNLMNALIGETQNQIISVNYEDDFDVHGYSPTPEESWALFSQKKVSQIESGPSHTLALMNDGTVWAWGNNNYGQCGNDYASNFGTPTQVLGLTNVLYISAGDFHSLALKSNGTVWSWGDNWYRQLGDGTMMGSPIPVQVIGLPGVESISAGGYHNLAIEYGGAACWSWGLNDDCQLGTGSPLPKNFPVQVMMLTNFKSVAAGGYHSMAVMLDGSVFGWGNNDAGQLGDGTYTQRKIPVYISVPANIESVSTMLYHSLALGSDGTVWSWGANWYGQIGDGTTFDRLSPVQVMGDVLSIAVGENHSLALKNYGTVWGVW